MWPESIGFTAMKAERTTTNIKEFGDFQTPLALAIEITSVLQRLNIDAKAILEPTCGKGAFVSAAASTFMQAACIFGVEINGDYVEAARELNTDSRVRIFEGDFFHLNWFAILDQSNGPWLILGNPPWVTASALGALSSGNLPKKTNEKGLAGVEAITGKSNFDISEWMILRYLEWVAEKQFTIAVLCKVTVARKILASAWANDHDLEDSLVYRIDAERHFGVAVDACLFVLRSGFGKFSKKCAIYDNLEALHAACTISFADGQIIGDAVAFHKNKHLIALDANYQWRSGIKHDCSKVMELKMCDRTYTNGFDHVVEVEEEFVYPMLKSSGLTSPLRSARKMLVPQRYPGENIFPLANTAPKTWRYLTEHRELLRKRASSIYKNKGDFAIFGVGPYSFTPWKVAISGFYKTLKFTVVGPIEGRPVVFDDTVYFLSCHSQSEAVFISGLLNSIAAQELYKSMIHWEAKRPITVQLLKQLSLARLASSLGCVAEYETHLRAANRPLSKPNSFGLFQFA